MEHLKDEIYFDIFLVDIKMPGIDGLKLVEELRRYEPMAFWCLSTAITLSRGTLISLCVY